MEGPGDDGASGTPVPVAEPPTLAGLLRRHRRAAGLTQEALSQRSTVSVDTISLLERGVVRRPHPGTVELLADALDLDQPARTRLLAAVPDVRPSRRRTLPRRRLVALVGLAAAALAGAGWAAVLVAFPHWSPPADPPALGAVQLRAEPGDVLHCPSGSLTVRGVIEVRGGSGTVTYHWVHPDGRRGPDTSVRVPAGTRELGMTLRLQVEGGRPGPQTVLLDVSRPRPVSEHLTFLYVCP